MGGRVLLTALLASLLLAALAPVAHASTADIIAPSDPENPQADSGWQAGTCKSEPPEPGAALCSVETPDQFFKRASAHPNWGFTQFIVRNEPLEVGGVVIGPEEPVGELKTVRVDLPVGLSVNPGATEKRCPMAVFEAGAGGCPPESQVGESFVTTSLLGTPTPPTKPLTQVPVYNVIPKEGEPARFGLELAENEVFLEADVAWHSDYHEGFTIQVPRAVELEPLISGLVLKNRLVFNGRAGDGTFITTPSTCLGEAAPGPSGTAYSTYLLAGSYQEAETIPGYQFPASAAPPLESRIPPGTEPEECATIPYDPSLNVTAGTATTDSPAGAVVEATVPHIVPPDPQDEVQESSQTRAARVALPTGMALNPSAANGLKACDDGQFGKGTRNPVSCPAESKIGTVTIETPPLPEGDLTGNVYVGQPIGRDPTSGTLYRIFIAAESARYGISARFIGNVRADPVTGQLTTTISETPQVPFTSFQLDFDDGPKAVLSSAQVCEPNPATSEMTPWSGNPSATPESKIVFADAPGGGPCPKTLGERPFGPSFDLRPQGTKAGAFSPVSLNLARGDGQQEVKRIDITLAPGMTGKLAGIPYCPESAIAAAANRDGNAEQAAPSCPQSQVGTATIASGTGPSPIQIVGRVFLSGPYRGAPLSLAVLTPATAGPFDLGTVVVRVALFVDPETAQIRAVSDPIPHIFGGAQLSIRSIDVDVDRKNFTLNPTSCEVLASGGALNGGGADPNNAAAFSAFAVSTPFQTTQCNALGFKPKLSTRLFGGKKAMRRSGHPKFRAVLTARNGDANIRRAVLTLPRALFLDQSNIRTICTRVQLAANACPKAAIYGFARAETPLLDKDLAGPVYLTSSSNLLPDLLVDLRGQVNVRLRGVIDTSKARIRNVFATVPDVPVRKFTITMKGGKKKGLLESSQNLCAHRSFSFLNLKAQNGKRLKVKRLPLRTPSCRKAGKRKAKG